MRLPNFFVVGSAKSGTTALWSYFQMHPDLYVTNDIRHKELGYFSDFYGIKELDDYLSYFKQAEERQLIGEVCHSYISSPESAERIYKDVPNAKIIMILRNPVDRAYSLYNWMVMHGYEKANSFEKALMLENVRAKDKEFKKTNVQGFYQNYMYFSSGKYSEQLKRFYAIFKYENIKVILYKDFKSNQESVMADIFAFLEVKNFSIPEMESINVSKRVLFPLLNYKYVRKLDKFPMAQLSFFRRIVLSLNMRNMPPKKINNQTKDYLRREYMNDVQELSKLLDVNLVDRWLKD